MLAFPCVNKKTLRSLRMTGQTHSWVWGRTPSKSSGKGLDTALSLQWCWTNIAWIILQCIACSVKATAKAKTSLAPPPFHHLRLHILHITYASVHHLRLNQLFTCASYDLIPITARGILLFAHSSSASIKHTYMFVVVVVVVVVVAVVVVVVVVVVGHIRAWHVPPLWPLGFGVGWRGWGMG